MADSILGIAAQQGVGAEPSPAPDTNASVLGEAQNVDTSVEPYIQGLFASVETSEDTSGDWLQLEHTTFEDLKNRKKIRGDIPWGEVRVKPATYNEVAKAYINDLMETFDIPTIEEAALWSWRPGWYKKYGGDINKIPDSAKGVKGKSGKQVMLDREKNLNYFIERTK